MTATLTPTATCVQGHVHTSWADAHGCNLDSGHANSLAPYVATAIARPTSEHYRVHRLTCRKALTAEPLHGDHHGDYVLATCCKPNAEQVEAGMDALLSEGVAEAEAALAADERAHNEQHATDRDVHDAPVGEVVSDGYVPATDRNLVAEKRERLDRAAAGKGKRGSRKTGDPRADRKGLSSTVAEVLPLSPVAYPEALEGVARCWGECGQVLPVTRFPYIANKGDGKGRMVECGPCQVKRLARNKEAKASGGTPEPKPRASL